MQRPRKIKVVRKKIHARIRKVLQHWVSGSVWSDGGRRGEIDSSCKEFTGGERRTDRRLRLFQRGVLVELRKVVSESAMQSFWLKCRIVRLQMVDVTDANFLVEKHLGKLGRRSTTSYRLKERIERFRTRTCFMPCLCLGNN